MLSPLLLLALPLLQADDRVKIDNEFIRVLKVTDVPHQKTPLHSHQFNRVMVYLNSGNLDVRYEDGKTTHQKWRAQDVDWSIGGPKHISENVGSEPLGIVEVEIKQPGPKSPPTRNPKLDPVAIDPTHNVMLFENDQVRVFRSWREPGKTETLHEHTGKGRVVVLLTDIQAKVENPNGQPSQMNDKAGEVHWTPGTSLHAGTNVGPKRFDMILIEVK